MPRGRPAATAAGPPDEEPRVRRGRHVMVRARPVDPWDESAVTLLGDAVHTVTPGRGEAANTALRDAALLTAVLSEAVTGRTRLAAAKRRYETEMLGYGFAAAASSTKPFFADAMRRRP